MCLQSYFRRLDSNAFVCDCQMMWLKDMIAEKRDSTQAAATCHYPNQPSDNAQNVVNIEEAEFHCSKYTEYLDLGTVY